MTFKDWIPPVVYNNLSDFFVKKEGGSFWYVFASSRDTFNKIDYLESYEEIPELNAIINMKARTFSNFRLKAIDKDNNEVNNTETERVKALITKPNWFQDGKEFLIQTKILREIFGNEFVFAQTPFGFDANPIRVKGLFTLPGNIVKCEYQSSIPFFMNDSKTGVSYKYKPADGLDWKSFESGKIIHMNDNRARIKSATDKKLLLGQSKMEAEKSVINNIRMAYESRGIILKYRGADGAWVNKQKDQQGRSLPMFKDDKDILQNAYKGYGTLAGQHQTMITDADVAWVQAGVKNPANLGIFEEIQEDFNKLLDSRGVPPEIFARTQGSTYENQKQAEKGLYVRTIIPEANEWVGAVTSELSVDKNVTYIADYTHLPIFQEDLKARGDALNSMVTALSKALSDQAITIETYQDEIAKFGFTK